MNAFYSEHVLAKLPENTPIPEPRDPSPPPSCPQHDHTTGHIDKTRDAPHEPETSQHDPKTTTSPAVKSETPSSNAPPPCPNPTPHTEPQDDPARIPKALLESSVARHSPRAEIHRPPSAFDTDTFLSNPSRLPHPTPPVVLIGSSVSITTGTGFPVITTPDNAPMGAQEIRITLHRGLLLIDSATDTAATPELRPRCVPEAWAHAQLRSAAAAAARRVAARATEWATAHTRTALYVSAGAPEAARGVWPTHSDAQETRNVPSIIRHDTPDVRGALGLGAPVTSVPPSPSPPPFSILPDPPPPPGHPDRINLDAAARAASPFLSLEARPSGPPVPLSRYSHHTGMPRQGVQATVGVCHVAFETGRAAPAHRRDTEGETADTVPLRMFPRGQVPGGVTTTLAWIAHVARGGEWLLLRGHGPAQRRGPALIGTSRGRRYFVGLPGPRFTKPAPQEHPALALAQHSFRRLAALPTPALPDSVPAPEWPRDITPPPDPVDAAIATRLRRREGPDVWAKRLRPLSQSVSPPGRRPRPPQEPQPAQPDSSRARISSPPPPQPSTTPLESVQPQKAPPSPPHSQSPLPPPTGVPDTAAAVWEYPLPRVALAPGRPDQGPTPIPTGFLLDRPILPPLTPPHTIPIPIVLIARVTESTTDTQSIPAPAVLFAGGGSLVSAKPCVPSFLIAELQSGTRTITLDPAIGEQLATLPPGTVVPPPLSAALSGAMSTQGTSIHIEHARRTALHGIHITGLAGATAVQQPGPDDVYGAGREARGLRHHFSTTPPGCVPVTVWLDVAPDVAPHGDTLAAAPLPDMAQLVETSLLCHAGGRCPIPAPLPPAAWWVVGIPGGPLPPPESPAIPVCGVCLCGSDSVGVVHGTVSLRTAPPDTHPCGAAVADWDLAVRLLRHTGGEWGVLRISGSPSPGGDFHTDALLFAHNPTASDTDSKAHLFSLGLPLRPASQVPHSGHVPTDPDSPLTLLGVGGMAVPCTVPLALHITATSPDPEPQDSWLSRVLPVQEPEGPQWAPWHHTWAWNLIRRMPDRTRSLPWAPGPPWVPEPPVFAEFRPGRAQALLSVRRPYGTPSFDLLRPGSLPVPPPHVALSLIRKAVSARRIGIVPRRPGTEGEDPTMWPPEAVIERGALCAALAALEGVGSDDEPLFGHAVPLKPRDVAEGLWFARWPARPGIRVGPIAIRHPAFPSVAEVFESGRLGLLFGGTHPLLLTAQLRAIAYAIDRYVGTRLQPTAQGAPAAPSTPPTLPTCPECRATATASAPPALTLVSLEHGLVRVHWQSRVPVVLDLLPRALAGAWGLEHLAVPALDETHFRRAAAVVAVAAPSRWAAQAGTASLPLEQPRPPKQLRRIFCNVKLRIDHAGTVGVLRARTEDDIVHALLHVALPALTHCPNLAAGRPSVQVRVAAAPTHPPHPPQSEQEPTHPDIPEWLCEEL